LFVAGGVLKEHGKTGAGRMERHRVVVLRRQMFSNTSLQLSVWSRRIGWMEVTARGMMRSKNNRLGDIADEFDVSEIVVYRKPNSLFLSSSSTTLSRRARPCARTG